ncbi:hypothetical protein DY000_02002581 [Brassica cretica]|uniref:Post-GPI attachment to proteins factor 3 n=1 Tax=Brassica cretica TaxID=69181 RepID=A0ABQ7C3L2_BRACR|nr:hypothetical protein DY000_02002581 [Brassica cretica]
MMNSWEPLYSENYMKAKKTNKKFDFKVFTDTGPKTSLITDGTQQIFHTRDVDITKRLDYSSAVAVLGFSLIVSILRTFDVRVETARVMVSAPVLALVTTHVLCINFYKLYYASGLAMLLEIYDFPPYGGYFDAHSIWHLATVLLTILWWSFIRDDAEFRTSSLLKKSKTKAKLFLRLRISRMSVMLKMQSIGLTILSLLAAK